MPLRSPHFCSLAAAVALGTAMPLHAATIIGEWNLDAAACADARVTYTAAGRHESLLRGPGGWSTAASGSYELDGETLTVEFQGQSEMLEVVRLDEDTLELRNAEPKRMDEAGVDSVRFVRCPARDSGE